MLHASLLNTTVVAFKILALGSYAPMSAPSSLFKTILEMVLWNVLQSYRCINPDVININKMPYFQYFLYLPIFTPLQGHPSFQLLLSPVADDRSINNVTNFIQHGGVICKRYVPLKVVVSHSFPFSFLSFFSNLIFISHTENRLYIDWTKGHFIWQPKIYRYEMF